MVDGGKAAGRAGRHRSRGTLHAVPTPPGNRKPRLDQETLARLDLLLADRSLSRNEIARQAGLSPDTVSRRAGVVGRKFTAAMDTAVATEVKMQDGRARRRALAERLLADATAEADVRDELDRREARDAQARSALSRSIGTLVKAVADLDAIEVRYRELERETRQGSDIDEWLTSMGVGAGTGTE